MFEDHYISGKVCPYCNSFTEFLDSSIIYGKSYGMIYVCQPCNAFVGVHKDTTRSLGRLADRELREWKKEAHLYFDKIAKTGLINKIWREYIPGISNREKSYLWLSKKLDISKKYCHIGFFDETLCKKTKEISIEALYLLSLD